MNLHMKTTNQVYGDFEYVSGNYRNMNQPICMTTVPMVVDDAYRHWKREWLPTINHDYGHFYRVLAERRRSQKMKTPDAWSYNIHLGSYADIRCKDPKCLKDKCSTSHLAENHRDYKRLDRNRLKMTNVTNINVDIVDKEGQTTSIRPADDCYHHIVRPCIRRTLQADDIKRLNIRINNHDGTCFRMSAVPHYYHFGSYPNMSAARMRSTYPDIIAESDL
ncbi:hypothetical protein LSAT2_032006 [Lamellibrachia satsuma]|nr:hypothetical protein LSAT2_032006 [Lamellibrachia satsuma]